MLESEFCHVVNDSIKHVSGSETPVKTLGTRAQVSILAW